jgi:hypothetical protein
VKIRCSLGPKRTSRPAFLWLELQARSIQIIGDPSRYSPTATVTRIEVWCVQYCLGNHSISSSNQETPLQPHACTNACSPIPRSSTVAEQNIPSAKAIIPFRIKIQGDSIAVS